jgi:hypothetical protein
LNRFVGQYYSDELDATFDITKSGSTLLLKRARSGPDTLRATPARGAFRADGLALRFDDGDRPAALFTIDAGRAHGIDFHRMASTVR